MRWRLLTRVVLANGVTSDRASFHWSITSSGGGVGFEGSNSGRPPPVPVGREAAPVDHTALVVHSAIEMPGDRLEGGTTRSGAAVHAGPDALVV